jgi:hypothetical protein
MSIFLHMKCFPTASEAQGREISVIKTTLAILNPYKYDHVLTYLIKCCVICSLGGRSGLHPLNTARRALVQSRLTAQLIV